MRQRRSLAFSHILVVALALAVTGRRSMDAQSTCSQCLNGFRFLPSSIIGSPFASTYFINATGGGIALDLTVPVRNLAGQEVGSVEGDIGFLLVDFEYQYAVARWLALRVSATGAGRVGTSKEAVIASGASAVFGGSLGATVPVWKNEAFYVSAVADVRQNKQFLIDPYGFARDINDRGYDDESKSILLRAEDGNRWSLGLRGAWAIQPWVGLNAQVESGLLDGPSNDNESLTELGLQASFDFLQLWSAPVGVTLGYRQHAGPARTGDFSGSYRVYELGLFYTGRREFTVGGDFFWSRVAIDDFEGIPDLDAVQFRLVTRLDF